MLTTSERFLVLNPESNLKSLCVQPVPFLVAKSLVVRYHYLRSIPGGTQLTLGVFLEKRLMGVIVFGAGPQNSYRLVAGARPQDCLTLTRLWLSDELPGNSESRVLGITLKALRKHTSLKFLVTYADPAQGHRGVVYQATNWLYTGLSSATPLYDIGDGIARHSRTLAHELGSHTIRFWKEYGVGVKAVPQVAKHRYIRFLDESWRIRLSVPLLRYPKQKEKESGSH